MNADLEDRLAHKIAHSRTVCTRLDRRILPVVAHADDIGLNGLVTLISKHIFHTLHEVKYFERGLYAVHGWHLVVHHDQSIHLVTTCQTFLDEVYGLATAPRKVTLELVLFEDALDGDLLEYVIVNNEDMLVRLILIERKLRQASIIV